MATSPHPADHTPDHPVTKAELAQWAREAGKAVQHARENPDSQLAQDVAAGLVRGLRELHMEEVDDRATHGNELNS